MKKLKQAKRARPCIGAETTRRNFLGLTGAAAGVALLEGCARQETHLIEQALKRGPGNPGEPTWHRSICVQCNGGCEIQVRLMDGRAKKIEGDRTSLVNGGGICALGHSALQELYHPRRWLHPAQRQEDGSFRSLAWDVALDALSGVFSRAVRNPGGVAICCGPEPAERASVERLARALGASVTIVESPHAAVERAARRRFFGGDVELLYDFSDVDYVFASGASVLDRWGNPVYFAGAVAEARARGAEFSVASQRLSLTAAKADLWLPVRGSTAPVLRAISRVLGGSKVSLGSVAESVGVPLENLEQLLEGLGRAQRPGLVFGAEGGESVADVVAGLALQRDLGALPKAISIGRLVDPESAAEEGPAPLQRRSLRELCEAVQAGVQEGMQGGVQGGAVTMVITMADIVGAVPQSWGLMEGLTAPDGPMFVALASGPDATSEAADWVLPLQTGLERQQFSFPTYGLDASQGLAMHVADPVVAARGSSRHPMDVLFAMCAAAGVSLGDFPADAASRRQSVVVAVGELEGKSAKSALRKALRATGRLAVRDDVDPTVNPVGEEPDVGLIEIASALGSEEHESEAPTQRFTMNLFNGVRGEATGWERPWLAELPDPISSAQWGSWLEIHPQDATRLGLETGQSVEVRSEQGSLETTTFVNPATRPGTVAMPVGRFDEDGARPSDPRDLLGLADQVGYPVHSVRVTLSSEVSEVAVPAPIFGRGLHTAEKIPAGWKSPGGSHGSKVSDGQIVVLRDSRERASALKGHRPGDQRNQRQPDQKQPDKRRTEKKSRVERPAQEKLK